MEAFRHPRPALDDESVLDAFAAELHGSVVLPGTPDYEEARLVHNANTDRRPAVIVRSADASDVVRTVRFARETGRRLSGRGGGPSLAGYGTNDGGVGLAPRSLKGPPIHAARPLARGPPRPPP